MNGTTRRSVYGAQRNKANMVTLGVGVGIGVGGGLRERGGEVRGVREREEDTEPSSSTPHPPPEKAEDDPLATRHADAEYIS